MNKTSILVVEDDKPLRNLIVTTLKTHDYKYLVAENGSSAILEASSHNPDIVLLDLGLPDIEGVEVIRKIRTWSNMPIIVISARSEDTDKIEALDAGADDYITKPFSVEELLARIRVTQRRLTITQTDEQNKTSIFEMFYTGKTTVADSQRSLGLGLALCRSIIEAHDGTLVLSDHAPHGCNFTFTLPLSEVTLNE